MQQVSNNQLKFSAQAEAIFAKYPDWRAAALEALSSPRWPDGQEPHVVEVYDQNGLMAGQLYDHAYSPDIPELPEGEEYKSEFQAWFYDGVMVAFYTNSEFIVDRMPESAS